MFAAGDGVSVPLPVESYLIHTSGSETARNEAFAFREDACRPLPLVGRGKGWGALSRKLYERQIDAWRDIKKNGCPEPMDTLPDGKAFPPPLTPPHEGEGS